MRTISSAARSSVSHLCCEGIHRGEVFLFKSRVLLENLLFSHAVREPPKDIMDGDSHSSDAGFAVTLVRLHRNARVCSDHGYIIPQVERQRRRDRYGEIGCGRTDTYD